MKKAIPYILLFFVFVLKTNAQDPKYIKLTEKEGLPDIEFYDILEDNKGLIWLAADKGLYSFNGKDYKHYNNTNKRGNSVFGLKLDRKNKLWCNNISGQFFYVQNNKLVLYLDLKNELRGELAEFYFLKNKLYIFSTSFIYEVDLDSKIKQKITLPKTTDRPIIRASYKQQNQIYFTINDKIYTIDENSQVADKNISIPKYGSNIIPRFFTYKKEQYFLLYDNKLNKNHFYILTKNELQEVQFPVDLVNTKIINITENEDKLWFSTAKGILIVNHQFNLDNNFLKNDFITKTILDQNKTIWVSTLNNGIYIIPSLKIKWLNDVIINDNISTIEKISASKIAVGTSNGNVFIQDISTGKNENILINEKRKISALLYLKDKNLLLISNEVGAYCYDLKTKKTSPLNTIANAKDLEFIEKKNLIINCSFNHAYLFKLKNNQLVLFKTLNKSRAYRSFYDKENDLIYISYVDNVIVYDANYSGKIITYNNKSIIAQDICKTQNDIVWIATFSNGILGFKNNKYIKKIDAKSGLKSEIIQDIKSDGNTLWIVTDVGLQSFNTTTNKFIPTLINNNLNVGNINGLIINNDNVLFSNQKDFFVMDKNSKLKTYKPNEILITSIKINEKDTLIQPTYFLPYDKNRITINFHINGYYPDEELLYEYRLIGQNENWIPIEPNTKSISFNGLASNNYVLEIRVKVLNTEQYIYKKIGFNINQPFWKKWWFVLSLLLFAFGIIILFYKNKLRQKEKEKIQALKNAKFENNLAVLKLENLQSQMNPHFIFNALNSIQEYIILNQKNLASSYLSKFADLIRAYLDHSSKGYISLHEEIDCLNIYLELEKLRFEDKFSYEINNLVSDDAVKIPTMLIQPYVENAIKHGLLHKKENRILNISFTHLKEEDSIQCIILDNGVGREKASKLRQTKHQSFATNANEKRLELLNFGKDKKIGCSIDDLRDENNNPNGTKVTLLIPILK
ncbi:MAG: histidine kinase [Bacteroidota bacterium]